jgi:hypothetical protein
VAVFRGSIQDLTAHPTERGTGLLVVAAVVLGVIVLIGANVLRRRSSTA